MVELQTPFEYDPSKGNLLFDLTINGYSGFPIDFDGSRKPTTAYLLNSDPTALTAVDELGGFPLQFTFVPEPSTLLLCIIALGVVVVWSKRVA
jgi:hypothetical protein